MQTFPMVTPIAGNKIQDLVIVCCLSNPIRYASRYKLYHRWAKAMQEAGALLITVEMAFGERPFEVTEKDNPLHVQLRSEDELWHKENMINIGINYASQVFPDWKYCAWIDCDVLPMAGSVREWLEETVQQLQHYHVVQMFKTAQQLDPNGNMYGAPFRSFISCYHERGFTIPEGLFWGKYTTKEYGHPGFAWAATRYALDNLSGPLGGPLIEFSILGSGDFHMCLGLLGAFGSDFGYKNIAYHNALKQWQVRAERWIKRDIGFVPGSIYHFWHGNRIDRGYMNRWQILAKHQFDPLTDLTRDAQGLLKFETWEPRQIGLRDDSRAYFRQRNEDSIDIKVPLAATQKHL